MAKSTRKKKKRRLTIRDRLGQLTYRGACRLLGTDGESRLREVSKCFIDVAKHVRLTGDTLRVKVQDVDLPDQQAIVTIVEMTARNKGLHLECDQCHGHCIHVAATLMLAVDHKMELGLSAAPDPKMPLELLTERELFRRALAEREQRAETEKMKMRSVAPDKPWTDYVVTSGVSGNSYRVALRGLEPGQSYCSCPDFRTNQLGTCKHILNVQRKVQRKFSKKTLAAPYQRKTLSLRLDYAHPLGLRFNLPDVLDPPAKRILKPFLEQSTDDVRGVVRALRRLEQKEIRCHVYPDAEEFIEQRLVQGSLRELTDEIRKDPARHPLRTELLDAQLLPYQLDGIAFAAGAGRAILADDMGLGKTIQGIGVAELLAREANIARVLVVCPASLKTQWKSEIHRFCTRSCQLVIGSAEERQEQYRRDAFFTVCNYEQVLRDHPLLERADWDLIILDEAQRIKNWESKTSRVIKSLRSQFALVLSGTPLENRLEELFNVVSFVDDRRLGPAYRFLHRHRKVNDEGRVEGYENLDQLREMLKPILLRRTRSSVMQDLPERTTDIVRIRPTEEQWDMSEANVKRAAQIAQKKYLTELDLLRLQQHLLLARMAANSTALVDKEHPGHSSKLECFQELIEQLAEEPDRKLVIFSEWTSMLNLLEPILKRFDFDFVRLDGKVSQKQRQKVTHRFQKDETCRAILMSNAGSTGLNLQAANTVINVDLPWNPAVLEQRIARAHRMGQKNPVHVYLLVTEDTIEERMLTTLTSKHDLAMAALDVESDVTAVQLKCGMDALKQRLERLLGRKPDAPVDDSEKRRVTTEAEQQQAKRRERVSAAGGELLGAAMSLVGELIGNDAEPQPEVVHQVRKGLDDCAERTADGKLELRVSLANESALQQLAEALAKLLIKPDQRRD